MTQPAPEERMTAQKKMTCAFTVDSDELQYSLCPSFFLSLETDVLSTKPRGHLTRQRGGFDCLQLCNSSISWIWHPPLWFGLRLPGRDILFHFLHACQNLCWGKWKSCAVINLVQFYASNYKARLGRLWRIQAKMYRRVLKPNIVNFQWSLLSFVALR